MGTKECQFGEARVVDFEICGGAGLILAVLWEICFPRARQTESRQGGGATPWDLWDELTDTSEGA